MVTELVARSEFPEQWLINKTTPCRDMRMSVRRRIFLFVLLFICCVCESMASGRVYGGPKIGMMLIDSEGIDDIVSLGFLGGYEYRDDWSIEAELNTTIAGGEVRAGVSGDADITTMAGYVVRLWSQGSGSYIRGKIGYLIENMVICAGGFCEYSNDQGISYGITAGHRFFTNLEFEVGFTVIEKEISLVSVGVNF